MIDPRSRGRKYRPARIASVENVGLKRAEIGRTIAVMNASAPHLTPVLRAVRDLDINFLLVQQGELDRFWPVAGAWRQGKPVLVLLGDDLEISKGPSAFHAKSVWQLFRDCRGVVIVSAPAYAAPYLAAASEVAQRRLDVAIVECRPETQGAWIELALRVGHPPINVLVAAEQGKQPTEPDGLTFLPPPTLPADAPAEH